ncbi:GNAT family N-acetyltransferase, partial [Streptomyces albidoflavus]
FSGRTELDVRWLTAQADRNRFLLGHTITSMPANPFTKDGNSHRRHPKTLLDDAAELRDGGATFTSFLATAEPFTARSWSDVRPCRVCPHLPAVGQWGLCWVHAKRRAGWERWMRKHGRTPSSMTGRPPAPAAGHGQVPGPGLQRTLRSHTASDNPTSNALYQRIGYVRLADFAGCRFSHGAAQAG